VSNAAYLRFLVGTGSWFLAWGLQTVVLPWLVVDVLRESPARVGLAQSLALLPSLPLLLVGGRAADRVDPGRMLLLLHGALALLFAGLALLLARGGLDYGRLVAFAFAVGALNALQAPARDAQLYPIAKHAISRGVTGANLVAQAAQAAGGLAVAALASLGAPLVLAVQAGLAAAGAFAIAGLRTAPPGGGAGRTEGGTLRAALASAARSPVLLPVLLMTLAVGLLFVGPYGVVLPLLVRDVYGGGPRELGLLVSMLPIGGILGGVWILARGGIRRNGRALLLGQGLSALCVGSLAAAPPFGGAVALVLGWGVGSAFFLSAGRTLCHVAAPETQRGTLLALYAAGILGAGPVGSLLSGALVEAIGPHPTLGLQAGAMLAAVGLVAGATKIARS
jgi:MFS family permease